MPELSLDVRQPVNNSSPNEARAAPSGSGDFNAIVDGLTTGSQAAYNVELEGRPLTAEEITDIQFLFGDLIDCRTIRVVKGDYFFSGKISAFDGELFVPDSRFRENYSSADTPALERARFFHDITHILQEQLGVDMPDAMRQVLADGKGNYEAGQSYTLDRNKCFLDYNIEQQANMVIHYYLLKNGFWSTDNPELLAALEEVLPFELFGGERRREPLAIPT